MATTYRPPNSHTPLLTHRLLAVVAVVLLAHALLLGDASHWQMFVSHPVQPIGGPAELRFDTRSLQAPPAAKQQQALAPRTASTPRPAPAIREAPDRAALTPGAQTAAAHGAAPHGALAPALAGLPDSPAALAPVVPVLSVPSSEQGRASAPKPVAPEPAAKGNATALLAAFPDSARLEFDGSGQDKGRISYAGSATLNWLRKPQAYETSLEISAFGFRLITWTSKGALGPHGLEPLRFGDRRRGPEVATHFQRDKGLITFSSNRPEIALLPGAQDKLSALLQLTALVSGGPAQYPPGSKIVFQAADAYRAEPWEFLVGAPEKMELPGGTLTVLGFLKNPTVEFDQKIEVWLSPEQAWLPVRLRITEPNGTYSDLQWRKTRQPD